MRLAGYSCHVLRLDDRSETATGKTHLRWALDRRAAARDAEPGTSRECSPPRLMTRLVGREAPPAWRRLHQGEGFKTGKALGQAGSAQGQESVNRQVFQVRNSPLKLHRKIDRPLNPLENGL